jgi:hypothetical protein
VQLFRLREVATYATYGDMEHASPITQYREANDRMSLEQFGKLFTPPVDKSTVLRWERGQITPRRAIEIEAVVGIARHALLPEFFGEAA